MILGKDFNTRNEKIRQLLSPDSIPLTKHNLKIDENENDDFDVFEVPIDFLKYRIENTRTMFDQFIVEQEKGKDYFDDHESEIVQEAQHTLLQNVYKGGLYEKFEKGEKQAAPLIISKDGFVIAGNRRLAVYRDLFENDYQKYSHFKTIKIVIYPFPADHDETKQFESLQEVEEDVKVSFTWISVAMNFDDILDKYPENGYERIISQYKNSRYLKKKNVNLVKEEINMWIWAANKAKAALERGDITDPKEITDQEQVFKDWSEGKIKLVKQNVSAKSIDIYNHLNETIILSDPKIIGDRKYKIRNQVGGHLKRLIDKKTDELNLRKPDLTDLQRENKILDHFKNTGDEELLPQLKDIFKQFDDEKKHAKDSRALSKSLASIHSQLQTAFASAISDNTNWEGTKEQIQNIEKIFLQLKKWVNSKA